MQHFNAGKLAVFELRAPSHKKDDIQVIRPTLTEVNQGKLEYKSQIIFQVNIISPEKRPHIPYKVVDQGNDLFRIEFTTVEVGSYVINVNVNELTVPNRWGNC